MYYFFTFLKIKVIFRHSFCVLILFLSFYSSIFAQEIVWIPLGATLNQQGNTLTVTIPEKWSYWGTNGSNESFSATSGQDIKISCDCTGTGGQCMPFYATGPKGTTSGCAGQCNKCSPVRASVKP